MQIYVNKGGRQMGPFDQARVIQMLKDGILSPEDHGIRQGDSQWQKLGVLFPAAPQAPVFQPAPIPAQPQAYNQPLPKKSGSSKAWIFVLLGLGGIFLIGLVVAVAGFLFYKSSASQPYPANSSNSNSSNSNANTSAGKGPEYYKAFNDKATELGRLKPPLRPNKNAKIKGKIAIINKAYYSSEYKMLGFETRSNKDLQQYISNDENALKDYGLTFKDMAETPEELETLVQINCQKGGFVGKYTGGITAYAQKCNIAVIDYKANAIIAQKSFENRKPDKEITVTDKNKTEHVLLHPFREMQDYIINFPR